MMTTEQMIWYHISYAYLWFILPILWAMGMISILIKADFINKELLDFNNRCIDFIIRKTEGR